MSNDPCLKCPLPDCDESDKRCLLRRAHSQYQNARKNKRLDELSPEILVGRNAHFAVWKLEDLARKSERAA